MMQAGVKELGVIQAQAKPVVRQRNGRRAARWVVVVTAAALLIGAVASIAVVTLSGPSPNPAQRIPYLGLYERGVPLTYAGVNAFTTATGVSPDLVMYYSTWNEPFQAGFARTAAEHGAVPLVQINPEINFDGVSLAAIASGQYDGYLTTYAEGVRAYGRPVILSFGHEMNGHWYPWGYTHTTPAVFVAAWRHIVTLFRALGVRNATWMWTVNIIETNGGIPAPNPWWPGSKYVNWVGIDGYYYNPSLTFSSLFGPTIATLRGITSDPILIAETAAPSTADQPGQINDLFAGVRLYGLLGFVWFEVQYGRTDFRIRSSAAIGAFRQGSEAYQRPAP
jgi:mannan endo-1,4-beta-mannosidase